MIVDQDKCLEKNCDSVVSREHADKSMSVRFFLPRLARVIYELILEHDQEPKNYESRLDHKI